MRNITVAGYWYKWFIIQYCSVLFVYHYGGDLFFCEMIYLLKNSKFRVTLPSKPSKFNSSNMQKPMLNQRMRQYHNIICC